MKIINNELVTFHDVDDTLVMSEPLPKKKGKKYVNVFDPITNGYVIMRVHEPNVRLLKEEKHRGSFVIVWSKGGYEWASNVLIALELERYVDLVLTKPHAYFDDKPIDSWLTNRIYLDPDTIYKTNK